MNAASNLNPVFDSFYCEITAINHELTTLNNPTEADAKAATNRIVELLTNVNYIEFLRPAEAIRASVTRIPSTANQAATSAKSIVDSFYQLQEKLQNDKTFSDKFQQEIEIDIKDGMYGRAINAASQLANVEARDRLIKQAKEGIDKLIENRKFPKAYEQIKIYDNPKGSFNGLITLRLIMKELQAEGSNEETVGKLDEEILNEANAKLLEEYALEGIQFGSLDRELVALLIEYVPDEELKKKISERLQAKLSEPERKDSAAITAAMPTSSAAATTTAASVASVASTVMPSTNRVQESKANASTAAANLVNRDAEEKNTSAAIKEDAASVPAPPGGLTMLPTAASATASTSSQEDIDTKLLETIRSRDYQTVFKLLLPMGNRAELNKRLQLVLDQFTMLVQDGDIATAVSIANSINSSSENGIYIKLKILIKIKDTAELRLSANREEEETSRGASEKIDAFLAAHKNEIAKIALLPEENYEAYLDLIKDDTILNKVYQTIDRRFAAKALERGRSDIPEEDGTHFAQKIRDETFRNEVLAKLKDVIRMLPEEENEKHSASEFDEKVASAPTAASAASSQPATAYEKLLHQIRSKDYSYIANSILTLRKDNAISEAEKNALFELLDWSSKENSSEANKKLEDVTFSNPLRVRKTSSKLFHFSVLDLQKRLEGGDENYAKINQEIESIASGPENMALHNMLNNWIYDKVMSKQSLSSFYANFKVALQEIHSRTLTEQLIEKVLINSGKFEKFVGVMKILAQSIDREILSEICTETIDKLFRKIKKSGNQEPITNVLTSFAKIFLIYHLRNENVSFIIKSIFLQKCNLSRKLTQDQAKPILDLRQILQGDSYLTQSDNELIEWIYEHVEGESTATETAAADTAAASPAIIAASQAHVKSSHAQTSAAASAQSAAQPQTAAQETAQKEKSTSTETSLAKTLLAKAMNNDNFLERYAQFLQTLKLALAENNSEVVKNTLDALKVEKTNAETLPKHEIGNALVQQLTKKGTEATELEKTVLTWLTKNIK